MAGETVYNGDGTFSNRVQVMGSSVTKANAIFTRDNWTPLLVINNTVGTNKLFTIPANKEYLLQSIVVSFTATAVVGARSVSLQIDDGTTGNYIYIRNSLPAINASETKRILFAAGYPKETAYDTTGNCLFPFPPQLVLKSGYQIRFAEDAAKDVANDSLKYVITVLERSV